MFYFVVIFKESWHLAPARRLSCLERRPLHERAVGLIPWLEHVREATDPAFSLSLKSIHISLGEDLKRKEKERNAFSSWGSMADTSSG